MLRKEDGEITVVAIDENTEVKNAHLTETASEHDPARNTSSSGCSSWARSSASPWHPLLVMVFLVAPRKRSRSKGDTYECGLLDHRRDLGPLPYPVLHLCDDVPVVFDIETVFLYPWAVTYGQLGLFALVEMVIFLAMLVVGLAYVWAKGMLKWV